MPDFQQKYKEKSLGFGNVNQARLIRYERREEARKQERTSRLNRNRQIPDSTNTSFQNAESSQPVVEDRLTRLNKWKAERERSRRMQLRKQKPPFKVGIVHHKIYSPIGRDENVASQTASRIQVKSMPVAKSVTKITKVTEKRLRAKALRNEQPQTSKQQTSKQQISKQQTSKQQEKGKSFAPIDHQFKAPSGLPEMPLFGTVTISPMNNRIKNFLVSPRKRRSTIGRRNSSTSRVTDLSFKENKAPVDKNSSSENADVNREDTSIETVSLRLSSDEQELSDSSPNSRKVEESNDIDSSKITRRRSKRSLNVNGNKSLNLSTSKSPVVNKYHNLSADNLFNSPRSQDISKTLNRSLNMSKERNFNSSFDQESHNISLNMSAAKLIMQRTPSSGLGTINSGSSIDPVQFSPYVVSSRGKSNARKEQQIRRGLGYSPTNDIPTKDTVMQNLNISIEDEERTAQYFHFLLNKEIVRLKEVCDTWEKMKIAPDVTEDAEARINQAIGQTTLLLNKKFERFRRLVNDCETGKGEMLVTCKDLQGFWDMMYREVRDCDRRFEALEEQRARNWIEDTPPEVTQIVKKKAVRKKKIAPVTKKQSSIRALIMAARKEKGSASNILKNAPTATVSSETSPVMKSSAKSRLSNVQTTKATPLQKENTRRSLLQKVQLSETSKTLRSPLAIMKISKMCKTPPEIELDSSISYVNSDQTPGKSILKKSKEMINRDSVTRSSYKVNFNENVVLNEVPVDEETQVKVDLARALARIEGFDFDSSRAQAQFPVERKLVFDTDESMSEESGGTPHNVDEEKQSSSNMSTLKQMDPLSLPTVSIVVEPPTPINEFSNNNPESDSSKRNLRSKKENQSGALDETFELLNKSNTTRRKLRRQDAVDESSSDTDQENIRVLRNRSISSKNTPNSTQKRRTKVRTTSDLSFKEKENKTPSKTRRKSSLKVSVKDSERPRTDLVVAMDQISLHENRRRTTRRSVKFTAEDCTGCVESKPALPMTPHVRRSKSRLSSKKMHTSIERDLISFETPDKLPERVRRSRSRKLDGESSGHTKDEH